MNLHSLFSIIDIGDQRVFGQGNKVIQALLKLCLTLKIQRDLLAGIFPNMYEFTVCDLVEEEAVPRPIQSLKPVTEPGAEH